jgi:glutamate-ammonia-ligase adenylyltransferase
MSYLIPDPDRARNNSETFVAGNPAYAEKLGSSSDAVSMLFSHSQYLSNYCIRNPDELFHALDIMDTAFETELLRVELREIFSSCATPEEGMKEVRNFRKSKLLAVTLKDILKRAALQDVLLDMSNLADAVLAESLCFVDNALSRRYGALVDNALAVIALGKLGARELNYSSDVDIFFVYRDEGETEGIATLSGVTRNRISAAEYYIKVAEELTRFLSFTTEDGFAYRVDLRLRPQGTRGSLALSLSGYEDYYESWGQVWERAALLRARPVAGDAGLGGDFLEAVKPFVYRKYLDFHALQEIRRMKSQVEQIKPGTLSRDIKRGYGGIREIEFFIQVFQLIYGGKEPALRDRSTFTSLHKLLQKGLIGYEDQRYLQDNYIFLRTLEHRIQQLNDLQTHSLPTGEHDLDILARKMGFPDRKDFLAELEARRRGVRATYDSLLLVRDEAAGKESESLTATSSPLLGSEYWDMESPLAQPLSGELLKAGVKDVHKAIHCLMKIRSNMFLFQTIRGRRLLGDILPAFVDGVLRGPDPDLGLRQLVDLSGILASKESYLDAISRRREMISALSFVLSQSEYLSKILMSNPEYLGSLVEGEKRKKTLRMLKSELLHGVQRHGESTAIRLFRRLEEVRLGILFLDKEIDLCRLVRALSRVAEAVFSVVLGNTGVSRLTAVGYGKLGGREITFNSDLDCVFVTPEEPSEADIRMAERALKVMMSHTKDGVAYTVDTRLRPEGNKGPLVVSLKGLTDYYLHTAQAWEIQALLKARPVAGDPGTARLFIAMRKDVLTARGPEVTAAEIRKMRERIRKELSRDRGQPSSRSATDLYDIKLGPGSLEDLEFAVQYLQLRNCRAQPSLLTQGTLDALRRLGTTGVVPAEAAAMLRNIYFFYRRMETLLRLRNESLLDGAALGGLPESMGMTAENLLALVDAERKRVSAFWEAQ